MTISRNEGWLIFSEETGTQELGTDGEGNVICPICAKPLTATTRDTRFGCDVVIIEGRLNAGDGRAGGTRVSLVCPKCGWTAKDPDILRKLPRPVCGGNSDVITAENLKQKLVSLRNDTDIAIDRFCRYQDCCDCPLDSDGDECFGINRAFSEAIKLLAKQRD